MYIYAHICSKHVCIYEYIYIYMCMYVYIYACIVDVYMCAKRIPRKWGAL